MWGGYYLIAFVFLIISMAVSNQLKKKIQKIF